MRCLVNGKWWWTGVTPPERDDNDALGGVGVLEGGLLMAADGYRAVKTSCNVF